MMKDVSGQSIVIDVVGQLPNNCAGGTIEVDFTASGFTGTNNLFLAQLFKGSTFQQVINSEIGGDGSITISGSSLSTLVTGSNYNVVIVVAAIPYTSPPSNNFQIKELPTSPNPSSNSPICQGQTLSLFSATIPGVSYSWSGPNSFTSSIEDPVIPSALPAASGTYTVTVTNTSTGCSNQGTTSVTVNSNVPPNPTSNSPICQGQTLNLSSATITGVSYSWTGPNGFASLLQNPSIPNAQLAASGTYTVTVTNTSTGCSNQGTTSVTVNSNVPPNPTSNSPICQGQTLNLSSATITGVSYSWTGPNSFTSPIQNPSIPNAQLAASGIYTVTVTNTSTGCSNQGTTLVTVNSNLSPPNPSSNSPICQGQTLNLFSATIPGVAYSWSGPNSFTSSLEDPVIASALPAASGTYTVTITNTSTGCSNQGTTLVTVNSNPSPPNPSSNSPICQGQTLNLFSATISGVSYLWTGPNGFTSPSQNPSIPNAQPAASGTYTVTVTNTTTTGCSNQGTTLVTVNSNPSPPNPSSSSPVCQGQTLNLFSATIPGVSYSWSGPNSFTSSLEDPVIPSALPAASGTYAVTVTNTSTLCSNQGTTSVTVNSNVPANPTSNSPICQGQTLNLFSATITDVSYSWTGPNGFASTLQNPSIPNAQLAASGIYTVTVINNTNGCINQGTTSTVTINSNPESPNPSSNSPICQGQALNLFSATISGVSYLWTGPNSFTSPIQNPSISNAQPAASGAYTVTVTNTVTGCSSQGNTTVIVNPNPSSPNPSSNSPICQGETLDLFSATISGVSYLWTGPNGFTSTFEDPVILNAQPAASGTYTVTVTNTLTVCSSQVTIIVIVNPNPPSPIPSSNSPICQGETLDLFSATISGVSYSWTGPNFFTSLSQNPSISNAQPVASGTYTVTITNTLTGCSSQGDTAVIVNPNPSSPNPSSNSPICQGATLNLFSATISGVSYLWTGPNGFTSPLQSPSISNAQPIASGTYSVLVTNSLTGCDIEENLLVTVNTIPILTSTLDDYSICSETFSLGIQLDNFFDTDDNQTAYNWIATDINGFIESNYTASGVNVESIPSEELTNNDPINQQCLNYEVEPLFINVITCPGAKTTFSVCVNPLPLEPKFLAPDSSADLINICANQFGLFFSVEQENNIKYHWGADLSGIPYTKISNEDSLNNAVFFFHKPSSPTYTIYATAIDSVSRCQSVSEFTVNISLNDDGGVDTSLVDLFDPVNNILGCGSFKNVIKYQWGTNNKVTMADSVLENEINQVYIAGSSFDTTSLLYWVEVTGDGDCHARSYFNEPDTLHTKGNYPSSSQTTALLIYPNPSFGNFTIELPPNRGIAYQISITDIFGKMQYYENLPQNVTSYNIETSWLSKGIYIVKAADNNGKSFTGKLIIQ